MIYVKKSEGVHLKSMLETAKSKDNEAVYRTGPVYEQIKTDFYEKCYLCEDNEVTSIQIEHFEPHKNDMTKKYDWNNIFYSCGHCNNIKGASFWPLLNCTDAGDQVWESIEICFEAYPKATVNVQLSSACTKIQEGENTLELLNKILTGKDATPMKKDEAANLRKKMLRAYNQLSKAIGKQDLDAIKDCISDKSAFAGMLRWHLKNNFPSLFEQAMSLPFDN